MAIRKTRYLSLTPELEACINGRVAVGRYRSALEDMRTALSMLENAETTRHKGSEDPQDARAAASLQAQ